MAQTTDASLSKAMRLQIIPHCSLYPDSKVHGANMGPTWVLSAPDGPHVGHMNLAIRVCMARFIWTPDVAICHMIQHGTDHRCLTKQSNEASDNASLRPMYGKVHLDALYYNDSQKLNWHCTTIYNYTQKCFKQICWILENCNCLHHLQRI